MLTLEESDGGLSLTGELVVHELAGLRARLDEIAAGSGELTLDVSGLEQVDTAGLQLLVAFLRHRGSQDPLRLAGLSPALERAAKLTGLEDELAPFLA